MPIGLLGLLGGFASAVGTAATIAQGVSTVSDILRGPYQAPALPALPPPPPGPWMGAGAFPALGPGAGMAVRTAGAWAARMARKYGPYIASAIVATYEQFKSQGHSDQRARGLAETYHAQQGILGGRRRRMSFTNPRALRRAARRLIGYQRFSRRVDRSLSRLARKSRVRSSGGPYRRRRR